MKRIFTLILAISATLSTQVSAQDLDCKAITGTNGNSVNSGSAWTHTTVYAHANNEGAIGIWYNPAGANNAYQVDVIKMEIYAANAAYKTGSDELKLFAADDIIGPNSVDTEWKSNNADLKALPHISKPGFDDWKGQTGYAGVVLLNQQQQSVYGWVKLVVSADGGTVSISDVGFAKTANTRVAAGSCAAVGVGELNIVTEFNVFPNPASSSINAAITLQKASSLNVTVRNVIGKQVSTQKLSAIAGDNNVNVNIDALGAGIYFLELSNSEGITTKRFVKK